MRSVQVAPVPLVSSSPSFSASTRIHRSISSSWGRGLSVWHSIQVSHRGKYSIERLQALDEYCQTASLLRVLAVCILTPVPALVIVGVVELLPLRPISEGWEANFGMWIRLAIMTAIVTLCAILQARSLIKELELRLPAVMAITISTTAAYVSTLILLASYWVYPIPFTICVGLLPYITYVVFFYVFFAGLEPFREIPGLPKVALRYALFLSTQASLAIIYPGFNAVFKVVPERFQPLFVLVLPMMRVALKNVIARLMDSHEDCLPEAAAFSVELFNAIYLVTCMQQGGTTTATLLVISLDLVSSGISLWGVRKNTILLKEYFGDEARAHTFKVHARNYFTAATLDLLKHPEEIVEAEALRDIRGHSSIAHSTTPKNIAALGEFESLRRARMVAPPTEYSAVDATNHKKAMLIRQSLQMLFYWEYIVLVEYIECIIPLMYTVYMSVATHFPNAVYHPETRALAQNGLAGTMNSVLLYSALEFMSFVLLSIVLASSLSFLPLYQLAFVLENQWNMLQGKTIMFLLFTFQFTLDHLGTVVTYYRLTATRSHLILTKMCVSVAQAQILRSGSRGFSLTTPLTHDSVEDLSSTYSL